MLLELRVENLLLIEEARLELVPGLNVLTGETGAGKTVLAHALDLLLGGRARQGIVRPGSAEAYVEGTFELPETLDAAMLPADADELVLARRVALDGRTRAYANGRSISIGQLRELAAGLLSFYGQHEHRRLMLAAAQLEILDGFCGPQQADTRARALGAWKALVSARRRCDELQALQGARERELDLLDFELAEIDALDPRLDERPELERERSRLRNATALADAAAGSERALADEEGGASTILGSAAAALDSLSGVDDRLDSLGERVRAICLEAQDLASELRRYAEGIEADPATLAGLEERLAGLARLERKHGGTIASVLEHAERCRLRRAELVGAEDALEAAERELAEAEATHHDASSQLHAARTRGAQELAKAVAERLSALAMDDASFDIEVVDAEPGPTGADAVRFSLAPNRGVPAAPLKDIASGGELSRVMLAVLSCAESGGEATLVFDEIDAGIGGVTARVVGEQLRELAARRQVVCITHLPQVASLADRHFTIAKDQGSEQAITTVTQLDRGEVVDELVRMLGSTGDDAGARRHAAELLKAA